MPYDPKLWSPAMIPDNLDSPAGILSRAGDPSIAKLLQALWKIHSAANIHTSHAIKRLNSFRAVIDEAAPDASGSGILWVNNTDGSVWYDDPAADPYVWAEIAPGSGSGTKLATGGFTDKLSAADDDVQKAMDTLDDHNHDADYLPAAIGGTPTAGHFTKLASVAVPPPSWALSDSGYGPTDFFIIDDEAVREFAIADAQPIKELTYLAGVLDEITIYDATPTKLYTKTFNYVGGVLMSITLLRHSDSEEWTKTLTYDTGVLQKIEVAT